MAISRFIVRTAIATMLALAVLFSPGGAFAAKKKKKVEYKAMRPEGTPEYMELKTKGKPVRYYVITENSPVTVEISGPNTLKIGARLGYGPGLMGRQKYRIQVIENDDVIKVFEGETTKSKSVFIDQVVLPGKRQVYYLKVPSGVHRYSFRLSGSEADKLMLRFYAPKEKPKPKYVSLEPQFYNKSMKAVISQKTATYYLIDKKESVELSVTGPTKIKIRARGNSKKPISGKLEFRFRAVEDGMKSIEFEALKGRSTTFYSEARKLYPTTSKIFYLKVPAGQHTYRFYMMDCDAKSVSLRFYIPEVD